MAPFPLSRRFAAGCVLALLLPLASALAGFAGSEWSTVGRLRLASGRTSTGMPTAMAATFPDEHSFSLEDTDGLVLSGTMEPVGGRGVVAKGALDTVSMDNFATGLEEALGSQYGGVWDVSPLDSAFRAKLLRHETRVSIRLQVRMDIYAGLYGRTRRFKMTIRTASYD